MKKIKTNDWKIEEIGAGSGWIITISKCPYCNHVKQLKTIDYSDSETIQVCDQCKKRFKIEFI